MAETDPHRLLQRQKQINYGLATLEYQHYADLKRQKKPVPNLDFPDKTIVRSKRSWDGLVKQWRRRLHTWYNRQNEVNRVKSSIEYQSYEEWKQDGNTTLPPIEPPFPDYKYSEETWNKMINQWKADLNVWYYDSYVFIPDQYVCAECEQDANFRESSIEGFIFCGIECQKLFHSRRRSSNQ